jgi:hypothetical protein
MSLVSMGQNRDKQNRDKNEQAKERTKETKFTEEYRGEI